MAAIAAGSMIRITDAAGKVLLRRAITGVVMGDDFPVVWACRDDEWQDAEREGRTPRGAPWPAEDVSGHEAKPC